MPLPKNHCSNCGYDLGGLAEVGSCPECGNLYNMRSGAGTDRELSAEQRGREMLRYVNTVFMLIAAVGSLAISALIMLATDNRRVLGVGIVMTVVFLLIAATVWIRDRNEP